jgi:hypothetical protein
MGWVSFQFDRDTREKTYWYGPQHKKIEPIRGPIAQPGETLTWLKNKLREFYNVTDDMLRQPASAVKPDLFEGIDSRPPWYKKEYSNYPRAPTTSGQNTNTVSLGNQAETSHTANQDYEHFKNHHILRPSDEPQEMISLDYVDSQSIVLGAEDSAGFSVSSAMRGRGQGRGKPRGSMGRADRVLERVRDSEVRKPDQPKTFRQNQLEKAQSELREENSRIEEIDDNDELQDAQDSFTLPDARQAHDSPFQIIGRPTEPMDMENISAERVLGNEKPKKRRVQFESIENSDLRELIAPPPNKLTAAMLRQEVRGITMGDLIGEEKVKKKIMAILQPKTEVQIEENLTVNVITVEQQREPEIVLDRGRGANGVSLLQGSTLEKADWPTGALVTLVPNLNRTAEHRFLRTPGMLTTQNAQARHEVGGDYDTFNDDLDNVTRKKSSTIERVAGYSFLHSELPTCWATVRNHGVKCLIDTGSQLNLLRLSACRALKIPYEQFFQEPGNATGVVSANGSLDPFVGTAFNVPIRIGEVETKANFRIVQNLTRSVILGGPWCAASRLSIQYNVFGRVTCRIISDDESRNTVFIASDPTPHHPEHMDTRRRQDDSENYN